jgi:two-component system, chemotaxis family, sensor kinase CheA
MSTLSSGTEYAQFKATFFEECAEILADLDTRLARLMAGAGDEEELNAVFRGVHSIKAGAGAFGMSRLVAFTHTFEALLDHLRSGRLVCDTRVAGVLVRAGDIVATLVGAARTDAPLEHDLGEDVAEDLRQLMGEAATTAGEAGQGARLMSPTAPASPEIPQRYRISFAPHAEMYRHANEPLLLIRELKRLGALTVRLLLDRLPPLAAIEPEDAYFSWMFELETVRPRAEIEEVFEFVDLDCDLSIILLDAPAPALTLKALPVEPEVLPPSRPAGEGAAIAPASPVPAAPMPVAQPAAARSTGLSSIRVDLSRIDRLVNMVGELVITQSVLAQHMQNQAIGAQDGFHGIAALASLARDLQECVMAIRMQPVRSVFARMPRLVREVSGKVGKDVRLVTSGEQTEVDKTVIEELVDPLTHMIRNAIDHGIEALDLRRERGKPATGQIELSASHVGSNIVIQVSDDGGGFDRQRLLAKAVEQRIVAEGAKLSDEQIDELIFAPGFSTARVISEVSGRGVGMDVVRRNIVNLGGRIHVSSVPGQGSRFTMIIPLTLAVLEGMIVAVGRERYVLPLTAIVESLKPDRKQIARLANGSEVVSIRGSYHRLVYLHRTFGIPGAALEAWDGIVVLVETAAGQRIGILVDDLIGQQQVVIKSLQENYEPVFCTSGATILGDGRVALILDIEQLTATGRSVGGGHGAVWLSPQADGAVRTAAQDPERPRKSA